MPFVLRRESDTESPSLPYVIGKQSTYGKLVFYSKTVGPGGAVGSQTAFISILGEGVMDGIDECRYNGNILQPYDPVAMTGHYVFHSGTLSTGFDDPIQGRPTFFPDLDFTFSGIAYIEVLLDPSQSEHEEEPSKLEVKVRGKRIKDYNSSGAEITANYGFSANNARVAADIILNKMKRSTSRIDWPSWVVYRDFCDEQIEWIVGDSALTGEGLLGHYYNGNTFSGAVVFTRVEAIKDGRNWDSSAPEGLSGQPFSIRWTGQIEAQYSETYTFYVLRYGHVKLIVNGTTIIDSSSAAWATPTGTMVLTAGSKYSVTLEYSTVSGTGNPAGIAFEWSSASQSRQFIQERNLYATDRTSTPRMINRFDAHIVYPQPAEAITGLEDCMLRSPGCDWQDISGKITFVVGPVALIPALAGVGKRQIAYDLVYDPTQTTLHSNIGVNSFTAYRRNDEDKPNYLRIGYRDLDDTVYTQKYFPIDRPALRDQLDGQLNDPGIIQLGVMRQSLADRIGESMMRVTSDLDLLVTVKGQADCYKIAKGDIVRLSHDVPGWRQSDPPLFMVIEESFDSSIETADERSFTLQIYAPGYYSDTDHGAIAPHVVTDIPSPDALPPVIDDVTGVQLDENVYVMANHTMVAVISGIATFPAFDYPMRGRVYVQRPGSIVWEQRELITPNVLTKQVGFEIIGIAPDPDPYLIKVVTQNFAGRSRPFSEHPTFSIVVTTPDMLAPEDFIGFFDNNDGHLLMEWAGVPQVVDMDEIYELEIRDDADAVTLRSQTIIPRLTQQLQEYVVWNATTGGAFTLLPDGGITISFGTDTYTSASAEVVGGFLVEFQIPDSSLLPMLYMSIYPESGFGINPDDSFNWRTGGTWPNYTASPEHDFADSPGPTINVIAGDRLGIYIRPDGVAEYYLNYGPSSKPIWTSGRQVITAEKYKAFVHGPGTIVKVSWLRLGPEWMYLATAQRLDFGISRIDPLPAAINARVRAVSSLDSSNKSPWTTATFTR